MEFPILEKTIDGHEMEIHGHSDESGNFCEFHLWCYSCDNGMSVATVTVDDLVSGNATALTLITEADIHAMGEVNDNSPD